MIAIDKDEKPEMPFRLFEIGRELLLLEEALEESGGELPDEELDKYLAIQADEANKLTNIANWMTDLNAEAAYARARVAALDAFIAAEKTRWYAQAERCETTIARVTQRLKAHFTTVRRGEPFKTPDGRVIKLAKVGGKRAVTYPSEWDQDPARAPERFHRRKIELDKVEMRAAVEAREAALEAAINVDDIATIDQQFRDIAMVQLAPQGVKLVIK